VVIRGKGGFDAESTSVEVNEQKKFQIWVCNFRNEEVEERRRRKEKEILG